MAPESARQDNGVGDGAPAPDDGSRVRLDDESALDALLESLIDDEEERKRVKGDESRLRRVLGRLIADCNAQSDHVVARPDIRIGDLKRLVDALPEPDPTWKPTGDNMLDSLIAVADEPGWERDRWTGTPWRTGYELAISGAGGVQALEGRQVRIACDGYFDTRLGDLNLTIGGDSALVVDGDLQVAIGPQARGRTQDGGTQDGEAHGGDSRAGVTGTGLDALDVAGDAQLTLGERKILMTGTVNRIWTGGIVRLAGTEAVICGGAFARIHAGPAVTMAALVSGDVSGGVARAAGVRVHGAVMHYRAAAAAAWASGAYVRSTGVTIEPLVGTPSGNTPARNVASKVATLGMALCPFLEIAVGMVMLPIGLLGMLAKLVKKPPHKPVGGLPRTKVVTVGGVRQDVAQSVLHT